MKVFLAFLLMGIAAVVDAKTAEAQDFLYNYPEERGRYFEGDIKFFPKQELPLIPTHKRRVKRKFVRSSVRKWNPKTAIPFTFSRSPRDETEKAAIRKGLRRWEAETCLSFREEVFADSTKNIIVFTNDDGCASNVGRNPIEQPQYVSLSTECMKAGVIVHEIAHALGFWHEQSRADRNNHVSVLWRNIKPGFVKQFTMESINDVDTANIDYDFGSVMHYRGGAYSRASAGKPTIISNLPGYQQALGQRETLSFYDIKLMNQIYCKDVCGSIPNRCEHGGYLDPSNPRRARCSGCKCPDGFTGTKCQKVKSDIVCGGILKAESTFKRVEINKRIRYDIIIKKGKSCFWLIKSDPGTYVELLFRRPFRFQTPANGLPCSDYVEINNSTHFGNTGMRFCGDNPSLTPIVSSNNDLFIRVKSDIADSLLSLSYRRVTNFGNWTNWGGWTACTAPCGGCGTQVQYRICSGGGGCRGPAVQSQRCNEGVCPFCLEVTDEMKKCMASGQDCSRFPKRRVPCSLANQCCQGFHPDRGIPTPCKPDEF